MSERSSKLALLGVMRERRGVRLIREAHYQARGEMAEVEEYEALARALQGSVALKIGMRG